MSLQKEEENEIVIHNSSSTISNISNQNSFHENGSNVDTTVSDYSQRLSHSDSSIGDLAKISSVFQAQHPAYGEDVKIGFQHFVIQGANLQLSPVNALVNSGEMCLVMADNSSTTSTFLKAVHGDYETCNQFKSTFWKKQDMIYNDEVDVHFAHLTVDQTIQFAIDCKFNVDSETKNHIKQTLLNMFGLTHCVNTIVGDDYVRGISGGEKKRISIIESLIANGLIYLWDNPTKGLDSSTALEFIESLKKMTDLNHITHFVGINQVSEKMMCFFDKVILFYQNRQIFYGTFVDLFTFLQNLGFQKQTNQTNIEFIDEILGSELQVEVLEAKWKSSKDFSNLQYQLSHFSDSASLNNYPKTSNYKISTLNQLKFCTRRTFERSKGDKSYLVAQSISTIIQALVIGSLFYDMPLDTIGSFSRGSIIFFSLLFFAFVALAEVPSCFTQRPVVNKQKKFFFYHPAIETFSKILNDVVFKLALIIVFSVILYFLSGLQRSADRFFIFLLFLFLSTENMTLLFQAVAYLSPTIAIANALTGLLMLSIAMYASYVIYLNQMHPWFKWIAYINPIKYGFETMLSNELFNVDLNCSKSFIPSGGFYDSVPDDYKVCGWQGANLGQNYVEGRNYLMKSFAYSYAHTWENFGILISFIVFFFLVCLIASEILTTRYVVKKNVNVERSNVYEDIELDYEAMEDTDALKFEKNLTLSWVNVSYRIKGLDLLKNVTGYVSSGALTALMGESGAGKTTLLNALSKRTDRGTITGDILVNNLHTDDDAFNSNTGYVQQQDLHLMELTVEESLRFSCKLRGDGDLNYVVIIAKKLNLPLKKLVKDLSPKDMKMLSIGVELVTKPIILFVDEPTSGLDSDSALAILKVLKELSEAGQAILCTIHQPSTAMFKHFDKLLLLQRGGQTVYFGDSDVRCTDYFYNNGADHIMDNENPAEYILKVTGAGANAKPDKDWSLVWDRSLEAQQLDDTIRSTSFDEKAIGDLYGQRIQPGYLIQFALVLQRTWKQFIRDYLYLSAKLGLMIVAGLYIGFTFWKTKKSILGLQNLMFAMFMILVISSPLIQQIQAKSLAAKNLYVARELKSKTFHWSILVLSQVIVEIPFVFLGSTLLFLCFYFTIGVSAAPSVAGVFYLNYLLFSLYYLTFGLWLIYSCPDLETSHVFVAFLFSFTVSFCGVMQPKQLMPRFWLFMYRISPYTYLIDTFVSLVMHDKPVTCQSSEFAVFHTYETQTCGEYMAEYIKEKGGYLLHPESTFICSYCVYDSGNQFLKQQNFSYDHIWRNFGIMWVFIGFNFFAMIVAFYYFSVKNLSLKNEFKRFTRLFGSK